MSTFNQLLALMRYFALVCCCLGVLSPVYATKTYTTNADGTVTDPATGLIWKLCSEGQAWDAATSACTGTVSTYTWAQASALTGAVSFAGQTDWRLPSIRELQTIVERSKSAPAIDTSVFKNTPSSVFWSNSSYASDSGLAWNVYFYDGLVNVYGKTSKYSVRLVRGGQSAGLLNDLRPNSDYVDQNDGTVTHTPTGLTWKRCAEGQVWASGTCSGSATTYIWDLANKLTDKVSFAGQSDWRLPTEDELLSLVDYGQKPASTSSTVPSINTTMFPNTQGLYFWSGTLYTGSNNKSAWSVFFGQGGANGVSTLYRYSVRMVRSGKSFGLYPLTVSKTGAGQVTSNATPGIECGAVCTSDYNAGNAVTLIATPTVNFVAWGGDCAASTSATCVLTMDALKNVSVTFKDSPLVVGLPASLTFDAQNLGTLAVQTLTLKNTGTTPLVINIATTGDFTTTQTTAQNCGASLAVGSFCFLDVKFAPNTVGSLYGLLTLTSNAPGNPHNVTLLGTGSPSVTTTTTTSPTTTIIGSTTTTTQPSSALLPLNLVAGWNLLGNSTDQPITVSTLFSNPTVVNTVWKWNAASSTWQFFTPSMDATALLTYTTSKGYGLLTSISSGEGFWVNAKKAQSLALLPGSAFSLGQSQLVSGWNLVATGDNVTPSEFNRSLTDAQATPPTTGPVSAPVNLTTLWAWDNALSKWYFYAPSLESQGGTALADYVTANSYLDFATAGKRLGSGVGFWVNNNSAATPTSPVTIDILPSSNTLNSAPNSVVTFIVTVKDQANTAVPGKTVVFSADSGTLKGANPSPVTDASGTITALTLSPGTNAANRNITLTAKITGLPTTFTIPVVGTKVTITGPSAASTTTSGTPLDFTVKAVDSSGNPIAGVKLAVASSLANGLALKPSGAETVSYMPSVTVTTDSSGAATVSYKPTVSGDDKLSVDGLGATYTTIVAVSSKSNTFAFTTTATDASQWLVKIPNPVTVRYLIDGVATPGKTVTFGTTRGTLSAVTAVTDTNGEAAVTVTSDTAGPVSVSAQLDSGEGTAPTALAGVLKATTPDSVVLQANPSAVLPNSLGITTHQSALTATVRDAVGNPVQGVMVSFTAFTDGSNGTIVPGSVMTDINGQATAQFIPGALTTSANGVQIDASLPKFPTKTDRALLTVNGEALFISIGQSNVLVVPDATTYQKDFTVYVTDANGAAAANRAVTLSIYPTDYYKGYMVWGAVGLDKMWIFAAWNGPCPNEDVNRNGTLDAGEDINGNVTLEPGMPAVITPFVTTDAMGFATFAVRYAKSYAAWVKTEITAKSLVGGTESKKVHNYDLEMLVADVKSESSPANIVSPFGSKGTVCTDPN